MNINGKPVNFRFNNYAYEQLLKVKGIYNVAATDEGTKVTLESNAAYAYGIVWIGYLGWCFVKQADPELTFEEVAEWVDENIGTPEYKAIADEFHTSRNFKRLAEKGLQRMEEKKSTV